MLPAKIALLELIPITVGRNEVSIKPYFKFFKICEKFYDQEILEFYSVNFYLILVSAWRFQKMTNERLWDRIIRKAIRMGLSPSWLNYRWVEKETIYEFMDRKGLSKKDDFFESIHYTQQV